MRPTRRRTRAAAPRRQPARLRPRAAARRLRRDRDGAVGLRGPARAAAGHRPRVVRRDGGRRGHGRRSSCPPSAARSSTATASRWPTRSTGMMVVADPSLTADRAPELAKFLADRLDVDYFDTLDAAPHRGTAASSTSPAGCPPARPPTTVEAARSAGFSGLELRRDPVRDYPADDVAANLIGFLGTDEALGGFERHLRRPAGRQGRLVHLRDRRRQPPPARRQHDQASRSTARTCTPPSTATCSGTPSASCARPSRTPAATPASRSSWTAAPASSSRWPTTRRSTPTHRLQSPKEDLRLARHQRRLRARARSRRCSR